MSRRRRRKKRKPQQQEQQQQLAPQTAPRDPGERGPQFIYVRQQVAGVRVTEDNALTVSAVWACVKVISEALAALPWRVYRKRSNGGRDTLDDNPVDWLLHVQASPEMTAFSFREMIVAHALTWGNGYAEIERDAAGRPVWFAPLTPDRVCPDRDGRGRLVYVVTNPREPDTILPAEDVFHLHGLGFDGLVGYSVVALFRRTIGLAMATEEYGAGFFANDATPGFILEHPGRLTENARKNLEQSHNRKHAGPRNARRLTILEEGMKANRIALPNDDAQFIETRQLSIPEICRIFKVPPHKIMDLTRSTFSNIEQQELEFVIDCLMPWAIRLEQEANIKLFGRTNRGSVYTKHSFMGRLRGDAAARAAFYQQMLDRGIFDIDEVRELEELNPIPDGKKRFVQQNMQLLEKAGEEEPEPEPQPMQEPPAPAEEPQSEEGEDASDDAGTEEETMSYQRQAWLNVLTDKIQQCLRREAHDYANAMKRHKDNLGAWSATYIVKQADYVAGALAVPVSALALCLSCGTADANRVAGVALTVFIPEYKDGLALRLSEPLPESGHWDNLAPTMARVLYDLTAQSVAAGGVIHA